ncbi:hypothetical protein CDG76_35185 [Nostoc sp. 'Peltigera membranacea cyanobiont' 210A]|uniref:hypothetical protein n=1 Tax=Nostoc sp. 'Peltigera membranacea cyanobiont' 210A TaxID=2014529 RepID=UPI000B95652E|nr:hypothetical protein [Nostoc sp. 'Peltigera membranacea cyanobiont' 210A]OYD89390.1 hypothetical protein CDG76_35185 [Nostoc sp. 'Peltigera membranacea cyanobiont' 210A]
MIAMAETDLQNSTLQHASEVREKLMAVYGVQYYETGTSSVVNASTDDLYFYTTYIGVHEIVVERGDCVYFLDKQKTTAYLNRGSIMVRSPHIATVIRGYMPEDKSSTLVTRTNLPYVNGCSTKQVFPPDRLGDPTLQILDIPPYSSEQAHHIHSTVRVAYILSGHGRSIVGMRDHTTSEALYPGKVAILQKMCPHHFETDDEHLIVLSLHVFSSVGAIEQNHPMFNGTHMTS